MRSTDLNRPILRAVYYIRVSDERRGTGQEKRMSRSLEDQESDLDEIREHRLRCPKGPVFRDKASASRYSKKERPGYKALIAALRTGDVLCLWEQSRAARKPQEWSALVELCIEKGVWLCCGGELYDLQDSSVRQMLAHQAVMSEGESDRTQMRVRRDVRSRAKSGIPHAGLGWGWKKSYDEWGNKTYILDEPVAALIRDACRRILSGESLKSICRDWNARGIRRSARSSTYKDQPIADEWTSFVLRQRMRKPALAGLLVHRGEVLRAGSWPAIISEDEHYRLVDLLTDPKRTNNTRGPQANHLLTGVMSCHKCPGVMGWTGSRLDQYQCRDNHCSAIKVALADPVVIKRMWAEIETWKADVLIFDLDTDEDGYIVPDISGHVGLRAEIRRLQRRFDEIEAMALAGKIPLASLEKATEEILPEIKAKEFEARGQFVSPLLMEIVESTQGDWEKWSLEKQRRIVRLVLEIELGPGKKGPGGFREERIRMRSILPDRATLTGALS